MGQAIKILLLNPPSPPYKDVCRDYAGGFGIAWERKARSDYGQSGNPDLQPCLPIIAGVLAKNHCNYKVLDCQLLRLNKQHVLERVKKENPRCIISLVGLPSLKMDLALLKSIKELLANVTIVGVGATCRAIPEEVLCLGGVDIAIRSEYPYTSNLENLIEAISEEKAVKAIKGISYLENGDIFSTESISETDLSKIDLPCYDQFQPVAYHSSFTDLKGEVYEYTSILGSKGCHYRCFYCPYPIGYGKEVTFRSPKAIVDEIEFLHLTHGLRGFFFRDQSFMTSKTHALEVCREIKLRKLDIAWFTEARTNEVSREIVQEMKEAGCKRIHFGVETGDSQLISECKKGASLQIIRKAFDVAREIGVWRTANVIIGWPNETSETIKHTYEFVMSLKPDDINLNTLTPYPGTSLYEMAAKDDLILSNDFNEYTPDVCIIRSKALTAAQICRFKKQMIQGFSRHQMKKAVIDTAFRRRKMVNARQIKDFMKKYASQKG